MGLFLSPGDLPLLGIKPRSPHCRQILYHHQGSLRILEWVAYPFSRGSPLPMQETQVRSLGQEDSLEEGMPTHSSILAWKIPWTEEPGGLQSILSQRGGHG